MRGLSIIQGLSSLTTRENGLSELLSAGSASAAARLLRGQIAFVGQESACRGILCGVPNLLPIQKRPVLIKPPPCVLVGPYDERVVGGDFDAV